MTMGNLVSIENLISACTPIIPITLGISSLTVLSLQLLTPADPLGRCFVFFKQLRRQEHQLSCSSSVKKGVDDYSGLHRAADVESRNSMYKDLVNAYYDLATVFYEWGWGQCFHFACQYPHENFKEAIHRHEYDLASKLGLSIAVKNNRGDASKTRILDVGCGIGGPMRNISRFTGCDVTGITLNPYQVSRGNELNLKDPYVYDRTKCVQGDFMDMNKFTNGTFDAAYAIEATCHAPDRVKCYSEIYKKLKPGSIFACYEWCMTDKYDSTNEKHLQLKKDIEEGNGLPDIVNTKVCLQALKDAGFEVLQECDLAEVQSGNGIQPWYQPLMPSWNPLSQRFQFNPIGGPITNVAIYWLELLCMAPAGTVKTQKILQAGGFGLRDAGKEGIFTAMYLMVGRKPEDKISK